MPNAGLFIGRKIRLFSKDFLFCGDSTKDVETAKAGVSIGKYMPRDRFLCRFLSLKRS